MLLSNVRSIRIKALNTSSSEEISKHDFAVNLHSWLIYVNDENAQPLLNGVYVVKDGRREGGRAIGVLSEQGPDGCCSFFEKKVMKLDDEIVLAEKLFSCRRELRVSLSWQALKAVSYRDKAYKVLKVLKYEANSNIRKSTLGNGRKKRKKEILKSRAACKKN